MVSTDPAHSLGDALGTPLTARLTRIRGAGRGLYGAEVNAPRAFARWLREHRRVLADIIEHGTWLDRDDADAMLQLAVPGIDELMGLVEMVRLSRGFELVVVDTAPTGHALRLLAAPRAVQSLAGVLDALQHDRRFVRERLSRVRVSDAADRLIAALDATATEARALLLERATTRFHWVMLPEELAVAETDDALRALGDLGVTVDQLVINRVTPPGPACPVCDPGRRAEQRAIAAAGRIARTLQVRVVHAELREPRGIPALRQISQSLHRPVRPPAARRGQSSAARPTAPTESSPKPLSLASLSGRQLIFFGGKGGVGKTTVAAAVALRLAGESPDTRVLLLSTDPAHSLADVLAAPISDEPGRLEGAPANLHVRELDASAALTANRARLEASLQALSGPVGSAGMATLVGRGLSELIDLAPPGVDEVFATLSVVEACETYDTILVDMAPTGHAVRLLETPAVAREWVQALLRVLLKYREIVRPGRLAEDLVDLSRQTRSLQELFRDTAGTRFIVVARAAELPRRETARLLATLRRLGMRVPFVVVNALTPRSGTCPRCRAVHAAERREVARMDRLCHRHRCAIIQTPLAEPPPRGVAALRRWGRTWIA